LRTFILHEVLGQELDADATRRQDAGRPANVLLARRAPSRCGEELDVVAGILEAMAPCALPVARDPSSRHRSSTELSLISEPVAKIFQALGRQAPGAPS